MDIRVNNLKNFPITDENIISFKSISVEIPFWSLFSNIKKVSLTIYNPRILLNEKILSKEKKGPPANIPFEIDRINIIDGELIFNSSYLIINLLKFDLSSYTTIDQALYKLNSPHLKIIFSEAKHVDLLTFNGSEQEMIAKKIVKIEGDMNAEIRAQSTGWKINSFTWNTSDFRVDVNGRIFKNGTLALNGAIQGTPDKLIFPILKEFCPMGYMEGNVKIHKKKNETLFIQGEYGYNKFSISGEVFENLKGTVDWNSASKQILVTNQFFDGVLPAQLNVANIPAFTQVEFTNIRAKRIARIIKIDDVAPLNSIIRKGDVTIRNEIDGIVTLAPQFARVPASEAARFNVGGLVNFQFKPDDNVIHFVASDIQTEFGTVPSLEVSIDNSKGSFLALKGTGFINDLGGINKYTRFYIDLDLSRWNLKKGNGTITLDLEKRNKQIIVESNLNIHDFTTSGQPIETLTGNIHNQEGMIAGDFTVTDKDITGKMNLLVGKDYFTMDIKDLKGESQKILKILDIDLALSGQITGNFFLYKKSRELFPQVKGSFQGDHVNFYNFYFDDVNGDLEYQRTFSLKNLQYMYNGGKGSADVFIDYDNKIYQVTGKIDAIDLNRLNSEFNGQINIDFKGKGAFESDPISLEYKSTDIHFYEDRKFSLKGKGKIFTDFSNFRLETQGEIVNSHEVSPFNLILTKVNKNITGSFHVDLTDINMLIPWGNNKGTMKLDGQIISSGDTPLTVEGHAVFEGPFLSFPNFPHTLEKFEGDVIFKGLHFTLRSLKGTMGGGSLESNGYLNIDNNKLTDFSINLVGKNMNLYIIDRTNFLMNADLNLKKMDGKLLLSGHMNALSGIWKREVDEPITFNTEPSLSPSGSKIMNMLEYDLRLTGNNIIMENSFGTITGKFDLRLTGNKDFPMLTGFIESHSGKLNFSDKKFDLIKARIEFNNKFVIDPQINIESEAFIKDYRIKFNIKGTMSHIKPELQSNPPLPPRDILSLISLGELFEKPTSTELSSQIGTGTTGLIASGLTEEIKKRTKKIFGNYMLKLDPNISNIAGASFEDTSRLIVGKEITKDFFVVYSTNFSTKRRQVIYLQYQLSPSISLIGMRNENRQFSLDLRFRKRH